MATVKPFEGRMERWQKRLAFDFKKSWWWILLVGPMLAFLWSLVMGRVVGGANRFIDAHVNLSSLKPLVLSLWGSQWVHPVTVGVGTFLLAVLGLVIHAYLETRRSSVTSATTSREVTD